MCEISKMGFHDVNVETGWESDNVWITQDKQKTEQTQKNVRKKIRKDMGERGQYMFSNKADCVGDIWCHTHTIHFPINSKYFKINEKYKKKCKRLYRSDCLDVVPPSSVLPCVKFIFSLMFFKPFAVGCCASIWRWKSIRQQRWLPVPMLSAPKQPRPVNQNEIC